MTSLFTKIFNRFLARFVQINGREPMTPQEMMNIQNEAVRYLNKTKGAPPITKKPFQGFTPKVIEGGKKEGIAGIEQQMNKIDGIVEKLKKMEAEKTKMYPGSVKKETITLKLGKNRKNKKIKTLLQDLKKKRKKQSKIIEMKVILTLQVSLMAALHL